MGNLPTSQPKVSPAVTKPFTMAVVIAFLLWVTHGIQTNEWTALPTSVSQAFVDLIPVIAAALYTWVKHILRDKVGLDLRWLG